LVAVSRFGAPRSPQLAPSSPPGSSPPPHKRRSSGSGRQRRARAPTARRAPAPGRPAGAAPQARRQGKPGLEPRPPTGPGSAPGSRTAQVRHPHPLHPADEHVPRLHVPTRRRVARPAGNPELLRDGLTAQPRTRVPRLPERTTGLGHRRKAPGVPSHSDLVQHRFPQLRKRRPNLDSPKRSCSGRSPPGGPGFGGSEIPNPSARRDSARRTAVASLKCRSPILMPPLHRPFIQISRLSCCQGAGGSTRQTGWQPRIRRPLPVDRPFAAECLRKTVEPAARAICPRRPHLPVHIGIPSRTGCLPEVFNSLVPTLGRQSHLTRGPVASGSCGWRLAVLSDRNNARPGNGHRERTRISLDSFAGTMGQTIWRGRGWRRVCEFSMATSA